MIEQPPIELWGGVECTINRVGDRFFDQCAQSGHRRRIEQDLECFRELGLRTLRTGFMWELFESEGWGFADRCLRTMDELGMQPIAGLLHHGSGPLHTCLVDPAFPEKFAAYALSFARRFPHVLDYTPVNEAQTTSRFACLYRHWYPHRGDLRSYVRALLTQIRAVALAMAAVRSVQPAARLIHTEDAGRTLACDTLQSYAVEREHRRWLGTDLLFGRVNREHPLYSFLLQHGASEGDLAWFEDNACPPDLLGLNYYVTSDRFLDERVHLYPSYMRGGDTGAEPLVDIEAVRIDPYGIAGAQTVLTDAWERYGVPVAITEAHLGCEPAEQVRWLAEVWHGAHEARRCGVDVHAVTAWGLLGLHNWDHLCTEEDGCYEAGVFDLSSGRPEATELAGLVSQMTAGAPLRHPALNESGWWRRQSRLTPQLQAEVQLV